MFMATKLTCLRSLPVVTGLRTVVTHGGTRSSTLKACPPLLKPRRGYATKARRGEDRLKDAVWEPATDVAIKVDSVGRMMVAGGAAVGLGALCYYGLGMSNEIGAIEKAVIWPQHVRDRLRSTFMYLSGSLGMTALSAVAVSRTPALMGLMMRGSWLAFGTSLAVSLGALNLVMAISYEESPTAKHLAWASHAGVLGAIIAPLTLLGGPLMLRAAWCTAGVVGGLSAVAMCAPSEKFLYMGGPLAVGLGVVLTSSLGSLFLPPTSVLGAGVHSVALYGGLLLFGAFLLYDMQKVVQRAESHPLRGAQEFDPINESIGIYLDTLNIFMRLAIMLADSDRKK